MIKTTKKTLIILICFLTVFLRFYHLGQTPAGMTWDEAAIGYNGFSIWSTHRDEWLNRMPISFRSFGDYKAPLAIYLNGFFTKIFDLNLWAIRLPFALSGSLSVGGMVLFIWLLIKNQIIKFSALSLNAALLLTLIFIGLSPWHILFSRVGFESGLALTQIIWAGNLLLLFNLFRQRQPRVSWGFLSLSIILIASSFYTYHSAKLTAPLLIIFALSWLKTKVKLPYKLLLPSIFAIFVLLTPFLRDSLFGEGLTRAGVTVFAQQGVFRGALLSLQGLITHLSPQFLIYGATDSLRHSTGEMGVIYPTEYLFLMIGLLSSIVYGFNILLNNKSHLKGLCCKVSGWKLGLFLLIAGLLPAAIGIEQPHPNRALLALPGFLILTLIGFDLFSRWLNKLSSVKRYSLLICLFVLHLISVGSFLVDYFGEYQKRSSSEYLTGYLPAFDLIWQYHNGQNGKPEVDQIVMTNEYGQPYIFALLSGKINPIAYHGGALVKFLFVDKISVGDMMRKNTLVVTGPEVFGLDPRLATHEIVDLNNQSRFRLYYSGADGWK